MDADGTHTFKLEACLKSMQELIVQNNVALHQRFDAIEVKVDRLTDALVQVEGRLERVEGKVNQGGEVRPETIEQHVVNIEGSIDKVEQIVQDVHDSTPVSTFVADSEMDAEVVAKPTDEIPEGARVDSGIQITEPKAKLSDYVGSVIAENLCLVNRGLRILTDEAPRTRHLLTSTDGRLSVVCDTLMHHSAGLDHLGQGLRQLAREQQRMGSAVGQLQRDLHLVACRCHQPVPAPHYQGYASTPASRVG